MIVQMSKVGLDLFLPDNHSRSTPYMEPAIAQMAYPQELRDFPNESGFGLLEISASDGQPNMEPDSTSEVGGWLPNKESLFQWPNLIIVELVGACPNFNLLQTLTSLTQKWYHDPHQARAKLGVISLCSSL